MVRRASDHKVAAGAIDGKTITRNSKDAAASANNAHAHNIKPYINEPLSAPSHAVAATEFTFNSTWLKRIAQLVVVFI